MIDLTSLQNAIARLSEALEYSHSDLAKTDPRLERLLRAAAIQSFEFTYELTVKMLKRYLVETEPSPTRIEEMSFNDLIRTGYERGLLKSELSVWQQFRKDRGTTSHAYNESKAQLVFEGILEFLPEAQDFLRELRRRQESST